MSREHIFNTQYEWGPRYAEELIMCRSSLLTGWNAPRLLLSGPLLIFHLTWHTLHSNTVTDELFSITLSEEAQEGVHILYISPAGFFFLPSYWSELMSCCCWDPVVRWTYFLSLFMFSKSYEWGTTWRSERPSLRRARTTNSSWRTKYTTSRRDCTTCRRHTPSRSE